jgi:hypothetical protein
MKTVIVTVTYDAQPRTIVADARVDGKLVASAQGATYGDADINLRGALSHRFNPADYKLEIR